MSGVEGFDLLSAGPEFSYLKQVPNLKSSFAKYHWYFSPRTYTRVFESLQSKILHNSPEGE